MVRELVLEDGREEGLNGMRMGDEGWGSGKVW